MYSIKQTPAFAKWLHRLRDGRGRARIAARLRMLEAGHMGDCKSVGDGVSELRIHFGAGYRVYFTLRARVLVVLLIGGDKGSQGRDIALAKRMAKEMNDD